MLKKQHASNGCKRYPLRSPDKPQKKGVPRFDFAGGKRKGREDIRPWVKNPNRTPSERDPIQPIKKSGAPTNPKCYHGFLGGAPKTPKMGSQLVLTHSHTSLKLRILKPLGHPRAGPKSPASSPPQYAHGLAGWVGGARLGFWDPGAEKSDIQVLYLVFPSLPALIGQQKSPNFMFPTKKWPS